MPFKLNPITRQLDLVGITPSSGDLRYLKLDGSNANSDIDIGTYGIIGGSPSRYFKMGVSTDTYSAYFANDEMEIKFADTFTTLGIYLQDSINFVSILKSGVGGYGLDVRNNTDSNIATFSDGTYAANFTGEITQNGTTTQINVGDYKFYGESGDYHGAIVDGNVGASGHFWNGDYDVTLGISDSCAVFQGGTIQTIFNYDGKAISTNGDLTTTGTVQAEHLYSTDDAVITDDLTVSGQLAIGTSIDANKGVDIDFNNNPTLTTAIYAIEGYTGASAETWGSYYINYLKNSATSGLAHGGQFDAVQYKITGSGTQQAEGGYFRARDFAGRTYNTKSILYGGRFEVPNAAGDWTTNNPTVTTAGIYIEDTPTGYGSDHTHYALYSEGGNFELSAGNLTTTGTGNFGNVTIGSGEAGVDYTLTFDGETSDGVITWMEDEDYFDFADTIKAPAIEMVSDGKVEFRDGDIYINSANDGHLDLTADISHDFIIGSTEQMTLTDGKISPTTDDDVALGDSSHRWKGGYFQNSDTWANIADGNYGLTGGDGTYSYKLASNYDSGIGFQFYYDSASDYIEMLYSGNYALKAYFSYSGYYAELGTGSYSVYGYGDAYFSNDVSALSFTDRTPAWTGTSEEALNQLLAVSYKEGELDHTTLPEFTRRKVKENIGTAQRPEIVEVDGRDLGATITMLVEAVKALKDEIGELKQ